MSTKKSESPSSPFGLPPSSELTGLPPLVFQKAWQFPTVAELLAQEDPSRTSSDQRPGLFQELLLSRPEALYQDVVDHPEKYDPLIPGLTRELVETRREPTPEERVLLDAAILDLVTAPKPPPAPPQRSSPRPTKMPFLDRAHEVESALPAGEQKAFWWV